MAISVVLLALTGCVKLWQDNIDIKTYMITAERTGEKASAPMAGKLWIEDVNVLPPYNIRSLTVRENDVEYSTSYYSELLMAPAENFRNIIFDWFSSSQLFKEVSVADRRNFNYRLVVTVMDFYGDKKSEEAVLRIKVSLINEANDVLIHQDYSQRVKAAALTAEDYIRAYNEAIGAILVESEKDVAAAISKE